MSIVRLLLPWLGIAAVPLAALLGLEMVRHADTKRDLAEARIELAEERLAHQQTQTNYREAAEQARRADAENKRRVEAEQTVIAERIASDYQKRLADARARAERLRHDLETRTDPSGPRAAPMPGPQGSPSGSDGAAPEDRLSITERLVATEQALQLEGLQRWIRETLQIDWTGSSPQSPSGTSSPNRKPDASGAPPRT